MKTKRTRSSFRSMNSERRLESIFLFVTGKCNAKCAMCFYANDMAKKEKDYSNIEFPDQKIVPINMEHEVSCGYLEASRRSGKIFLKFLKCFTAITKSKMSICRQTD